MAGPLALVGSGEYTPAMLPVERELIDGRAPRYVQIPTAAAPEGADRLRYWEDLGRRQAERLGVTAVPVVARDRAEADDPELAALVAGAGLVYLSGGNPAYLADTLRDTLLWRAIVDAWQAGAALAGCSAGAMAFGGWVPDLLARPFLTADGYTTVGIDEETALVGGPEEYTVAGLRSVWILGNGRRREVPAGTRVAFPLPVPD